MVQHTWWYYKKIFLEKVKVQYKTVCRFEVKYKMKWIWHEIEIDKLHILQVFEWGYILYMILHTLYKIIDYRFPDRCLRTGRANGLLLVVKCWVFCFFTRGCSDIHHTIGIGPPGMCIGGQLPTNFARRSGNHDWSLSPVPLLDLKPLCRLVLDQAEIG